MSETAWAILATLIVYKIALLGIGLLAQRGVHSGADFFAGGTKLGPLVAAISASASSSSAWTLLGLSGAAYGSGLSTLWFIPGCVGGFVINWFLVAPRLQARTGKSVTLTEWLAGGDTMDPVGSESSRWRPFVVLASIVVLGSLTVYVASQLEAAGASFEAVFDMPETTSLLLGMGIVVIYTLLGGFMAVSLSDTLQGLVMAAATIMVPFVVIREAWLLLAATGMSLSDAMAIVAQESPGFTDLTGGLSGFAAVGVVVGALGIGIGYPGQPHVVNRFMALEDGRAVRQARRYALVWAVVVFCGVIALGLSARLVLQLGPADRELVFFTAATEFMHPILAGVVVAAVLSAIMSTADSQLLVAASAVTWDLGGFKRTGKQRTAAQERKTLFTARIVVIVLSTAAVLIALYGSQTIFALVLSAWDVLGCAFGPLVLVRLWRGPVSPAASTAALVSGAGLATLFSHLSLTGTAFDKRILPFIVSGVCAYLGSRPRPQK